MTGISGTGGAAAAVLAVSVLPTTPGGEAAGPLGCESVVGVLLSCV
jgi:hypothetical protein